jgi:hypothetical protein
MKRFWLIPLVAFTSCVVSVQRPTTTTPPPPAQTTSQPALLNQRAGLPQYPNASLVNLDTKNDGSSKAVFSTRDGIESVYGYFHNQLGARGWSRTALDFKSKATKLEAKYQRQGLRLELKLDQEGNSGRYKLEIDF